MMLHHDKDSDGASDDISHGVVVGDDLDTVVKTMMAMIMMRFVLVMMFGIHVDMSILTALRFVDMK